MPCCIYKCYPSSKRDNAIIPISAIIANDKCLQFDTINILICLVHSSQMYHALKCLEFLMPISIHPSLRRWCVEISITTACLTISVTSNAPPFSQTYVDAAGCPFTCWTSNRLGLIFWGQIYHVRWFSGQKVEYLQRTWTCCKPA